MSTNDAGEFVRYALQHGALMLKPSGFALKGGRVSPYFFDAGAFNTGPHLTELAKAYTEAIAPSDLLVTADVFFGPAYKGLVIAPAVAQEASERFHRSVGWASCRKEVKDHGEGGILVGHPLNHRRICLVDDVISSGESLDKAIEFIVANRGTPVGCVIAFDRQERVDELASVSAVDAFSRRHGIPVYAAATLSDLIVVLEQDSFRRDARETLPKLLEYRKQYGVRAHSSVSS